MVGLTLSASPYALASNDPATQRPVHLVALPQHVGRVALPDQVPPQPHPGAVLPLNRPDGPAPAAPDGELPPHGFYRIRKSRLVLRRSETVSLNFAPSIVLDVDAVPEGLQALLEAKEAQRDADDVDDTK